MTVMGADPNLRIRLAVKVLSPNGHYDRSSECGNHHFQSTIRDAIVSDPPQRFFFSNHRSVRRDLRHDVRVHREPHTLSSCGSGLSHHFAGGLFSVAADYFSSSRARMWTFRERDNGEVIASRRALTVHSPNRRGEGGRSALIDGLSIERLTQSMAHYAGMTPNEGSIAVHWAQRGFVRRRVCRWSAEVGTAARTRPHARTVDFTLSSERKA